MTKSAILLQALELGQAIADSEEVKELQKAQEKLNADSDAYALIMKYQDARMKLENKQNDGIAISQQEKNHLDILEQQLQNNHTVLEVVNAQENFNNLMQAVWFSINQSVSGGCGGGDCGGSCSSCSM